MNKIDKAFWALSHEYHEDKLASYWTNIHSKYYVVD